MKAMILAAGLGTRLRPYTDSTPKALITIGEKTMLQIVTEKLIDAGVTEIVVNIHHHAEIMRTSINELNYSGVRFHISDETDTLLDTGGGIKNARDLLDDGQAFFVYNIDILCDINLKLLLEAHRNTKALATLAVSDREASRYLLWKNRLLCGWQNVSTGETILCTKQGNISGFVDTPKNTGENDSEPEKISARKIYLYNRSGDLVPDNPQYDLSRMKKKAFSGIHIVESAIFDLISETGVFSIKDVYLRLAGNHHIACFDHNHKTWFDIGTPEKLAHAREHFDTG
jgi:N-acetyl-alpha-D-muramate 1-phosphate uridylyltransferase